MELVTMDTRAEYCAAFVDYTFNSSVKAQFDAFKEGFMKVCDGKVLVRLLCVCVYNFIHNNMYYNNQAVYFVLK